MLVFKKQWFEGSLKSSWELFMAVLGIKAVSNAEKFHLFKTITIFWDIFTRIDDQHNPEIQD